MKRQIELPNYAVALILGAIAISVCSFFTRFDSLKDYPTLMLSAAVTVICVICFLFYIFSKGSLTEKLEKQKHEAILKVGQQVSQEKQALTKKISELEQKLKDSVYVSPNNSGLDNASLSHKCTVLEAFRNSFPYKITDGYILYNIMRTEVQVSQYSRWQIVGDFGGELWTLSILRPDTQTYRELLQLISTTGTPQDIQAFSMHNDMLWM